MLFNCKFEFGVENPRPLTERTPAEVNAQAVILGSLTMSILRVPEGLLKAQKKFEFTISDDSSQSVIPSLSSSISTTSGTPSLSVSLFTVIITLPILC